MAQNLLETPTIRIKLAEVFGAKTSNTLPANEASLKVAEAPIALQPQQNILPLQPLPGFPGQQMVQPNLAGLNATQMLNVQNAQKLMLQQRAAQLQALQNLPPNQRNLILLGNPLVHPFGLPPGVNHPLLPTPDLQSVAQHQQQLVLNSINNPAEGNANAEGISQDASRPRPKESRERRKLGFPPGKPGFTLIATRTLWLKKIPTNVTENELKLAVESCGEASRVKIIGNRACAFITMDTRRAANEVIQKLREVSVAKKMVKVYWARGPGMDADEYKDLWDSDVGVLEIPYEKLPLDLSPLCEGAVLDLDSLPESRRMMYKETGERVVAVPKPMGLLPPPTTQPPPVNFPFPVNMGQFAGAPGFNNGKPNPAGVQPLLNLTVPPPPGVQPFTTAPPPPGVGPPPSAAFNPHKPPPMGRFNSNLPPLTQFPGGSGGVPMNHPFLGPPQPMPFRGGADRGGYDMMRAGPPPRSDFQRDRERGRLPDQAELWKKRERERERERSQGNRWGRDEHDGGSRRRVSRWGDDDRRYDGPDAQRRSPRRTRRPSSNESRHVAKADLARSNADDETVSSTTLDELKPSKEAPPIEEPAKHDDHREDKTEEVPMDLE
uniref:RRM domain-containing protein n=1 Tax=Caenorhabditis japonica TaxID=281687 RepID=A0A8R1DY13_CAEJA